MLNLLKPKTVFISKENHKIEKRDIRRLWLSTTGYQTASFLPQHENSFQKVEIFFYPENDPNGLYRTQKIKIGTKNLEIRCQYTTISWAFKIESNDETAPEQHHNRHDMSGL